VIPLRFEKLRRNHAIDEFDCGGEALNRFLVRYALQNQQAGASQTYVLLAGEGDQVAGYYTLVVGQIEHIDAPERLKKGLARHPIPVMLLARLAVAATHQVEHLRENISTKGAYDASKEIVKWLISGGTSRRTILLPDRLERSLH